MVTAIKIRPTKMEMVEKRESRRESRGIKRTRNATKIQRTRTKILDRNAPRKSLTKLIANT